MQVIQASRRSFIGTTGSLSAVAVALLAGKDALAQGSSADTSRDVGILNVALGLEHEAIHAYQLGAGSGLLQKPVLDVAVSFQGHHKAHRDALVATIQKMGGRPMATRPKFASSPMKSTPSPRSAAPACASTWRPRSSRRAPRCKSAGPSCSSPACPPTAASAPR